MYYDNRYVGQKILPCPDDDGEPLPEMTDADWNTFPVVPDWDLWHNWGDERIQSYFKNPSFLAAGGTLVFGETWKDDTENDSGIPRVYFWYNEYARFTEKLTEKIQNSWVQYDAVVTMPKGGVAIGAHIAKTLGKPLGYYHANSYGTKDEQWGMNMGSFQRPPYFPKKWRILLVDDLFDTGETSRRVRAELEAMGYTVDTAAIFHKDKPGVEVPTHCLFPHYPPLWIVQPTEWHLEKGSMTEWHKIGWIDKNIVTKQMEVVASEIRNICGEKRDIRFFLLPSVSMIQSMMAIWVARLLAPEYKVEFIPTEGRDLFVLDNRYMLSPNTSFH